MRAIITSPVMRLGITRYCRVATTATMFVASYTVVTRSTLAQTPSAPPSTARAAFLRDSVAGLNWTFQWRRDWSRYKHPGECNAAIDVLQMTTLLRTGRHHPPAQHDTLTAQALSAGRACAAKFSPQTTAVTDLPAYLRLALRLDDLTLARRVLDARLAHASTVDEKASVILDALPAVLGRSPAQIGMADSLVQWLATLGPGARWWRVVGLQMLPATPAFDTVRWVHHQTQAFAEYTRLPYEGRVMSDIPTSFLSSRWFETRELSRDVAAELCSEDVARVKQLGTDTVRGQTAAMFWAAARDGCKTEVGVIGQRIPQLTGGEWFAPGDTIGKPTLGIPRAGHVTLIAPIPLGTGRPTSLVATYTRLHEKYAGRGLDIVLIHQRQGYVWGSGLLAPTLETQIIRWYDHDYLKLPFPIVVYDSAAKDAPGPMLIGRDGNAYVGPSTAAETDEGVLETFVRQALDASVTDTH